MSELSPEVKAERERCALIIQAARSGDIDTDLRTLLHFVNSGTKVRYDSKTHKYSYS